MPKVKLSRTIIGTPEEMEKYGGQLPAHAKKYEKRMSEGERAMYNGKLYAGTEMEVDEKRAKELSDAGLIEGSTRKETPGEKVLVKDTPREKAEGNVSQKNTVTTEPKAAAKASAKAATKSGKKPSKK